MSDEERDQTGGTPEPQDRDAPDTETAGTAGTDDTIEAGASGDGKTTVPDHLKWKEKAEKYNEVEAENKRLREQLEVGHQPAADLGRQEQEIADLEERRAHLLRLEKAGDTAAWAARQALDENIRLREEMVNAFHLQNVPDKRRPQVWQTWQRDQSSGNPRFRTIAEVDEAYEKRDLKSELQTLREENARLKGSKNGDRVNKDDVVRTTGSDRPQPPNATKPREMPRDEFRQKKQALFDAGDDRAARQMDADLRAGKITFKR